MAGTAYTYDNNGNLTSDGTHTYTWNIKNQLASSGSQTFSYNPSGSRYKTVDGTDTTIYVNSYLEVRPEGATYYIFNGSQRVASVKDGTTTYYSQDHLGGTALATNSTGTVVEVDDYYPYGDSLASIHAGTAPVHHTFTDKEFDDSLGLFYFEARWYNPTIGRFVSEDPAQFDNRVSKSIQDPQSLNFYAYSRNNPIVYIDPTGELQVNTEGAIDAQVDIFNHGLGQLQQDVTNSPEIQSYFQDNYGVDIEDVLNNPDSGPNVNVNGGDSFGYGQYNSQTDSIDVLDGAYTSSNGDTTVKSTLIHEIEHWATDGEHTDFKDWAQGKSWTTKAEVYIQAATSPNPDYILSGQQHGVSGYAAETVLYDNIGGKDEW